MIVVATKIDREPGEAEEADTHAKRRKLEFHAIRR